MMVTRAAAEYRRQRCRFRGPEASRPAASMADGSYRGPDELHGDFRSARPEAAPLLLALSGRHGQVSGTGGRHRQRDPRK
ncbi:MAG: hypothetical protein OJF58_000191 [Enhydrobacter sp.]|nr:MAG: hypothetical protein OJF58_000191 [Enhydrobacter sp.]